MAVIRPGTGADAEAFLDLRGAVFPYDVNVAEGLRHLWASLASDSALALFAAEDAGRLVGWVRCNLFTWSSAPGTGKIVVMVHPDHRGRGLGSALLERAEEHLRAVGARTAFGWGTDDEATLGWFARHGYALGNSMRYSALTLDALPAVPPVPAGVRLVSLADLGPEAVYAVDSVTMADKPGDPMDVLDYAEWTTYRWDTAELRTDLSVAVLVDGIPVAVTLFEADLARGRGWSGGTGTLREHRGRGFARLAKAESLRRAAEAGITVAYTSNDHTNAPMLAVNEWLGYRQVATERRATRTF